MASFSEAYERLNPEQKLAVDTTEGPVLVLAGPGTGKTQILAVRIANILRRTDVQAHNILALSFTQAAAKNMQQRLVNLIGPDAYKVQSETFHGFCTKVIEAHPEYFEVAPRQQEAVAEVDRFTIVEEIIRDNTFEHIKPTKTPTFFVRDVLSLISDYKREGHSPLTVRQLAETALRELEEEEKLPAPERRKRESQARKNREVAEVYSLYEQELRRRHTFDFEDMILWVRDALRNHPELLLTYQETFQYFLVDEFQDTNQAQLQLLEILTSHWGGHANVFAVGDPNQSIYRFQGASLSNTFRFLDLYPETKVISLKTGYRCGQDIYTVAAELVQKNLNTEVEKRLESLGEALVTFDGHQGEILRHDAANTLAECFWVVQEIQRQHESGIPFNEMAVLYRKHAHGSLLESVLEKTNIPYEVEVGSNILHHRLVQQIILLLQLLVALRQRREAPFLLPVLQQPWWQLSALDVLKVIRAGSASRRHHFNPWEWLLDETVWEEGEVAEPEKLRHVRDHFLAWQHADGHISPPELIEKILAESGIYPQSWRQELPLTDLNALASFLREVRSWYVAHPTSHLEEFLQRLEQMQQHGLGIPENDLQIAQESVRLLTAHQAKGQEWDVVFLLHANDTFWGNLRSPQHIQALPGAVPYTELTKDEENEDERRLFYVGLTRARKTLAISWSEKEVQNQRLKELQPSQFLFEMPSLPAEVAPRLDTERVQQQLQRYLTAPLTDRHPLDIDQAWLRSLIDRYSFSVSSLNEYLQCPVGFIYSRLIRIPTVPARALTVGTAAHAFMEKVYRELNQHQQVPALEDTLPVIDAVIHSTPLALTEAEVMAAQTKTMMANYYHAQAAHWRPSLFVERFFGGTTPVSFEGLSLVGKVDRIDLIDSVAKSVCVVDYKTGSPKSRNHIWGKTNSSDGSMYRQLVFYKLLAELDSTFPYTVTDGEFLFLEPLPSGKYKSEKFTISSDDVDELKTLLRRVNDELQSLVFLERQPCGQCEACRTFGLAASPLQEYQAVDQLALFSEVAEESPER